MMLVCLFFFFKQKTAYEMRISDWSSDVCSSDLDLRVEQAQLRLAQLPGAGGVAHHFLLAAAMFGDAAGDGARDRLDRLQVGAVVDAQPVGPRRGFRFAGQGDAGGVAAGHHGGDHDVALATELAVDPVRSEEHTSELQSLMRISYADFCLNKTKHTNTNTI